MSQNKITNKKNILILTQLAIFTAIEVIFCFTPLGSIPITGGGIVATLAHIPALVVAVTLGKLPALYMGAAMGVCSLIWWSTIGVVQPSAFAFTPFAINGNIWSLIICIVPRILLPFIAAVIFDFLKSKIKTIPAAAVAGAVASFLHSAMVLGLIFICFYNNTAVGNDFVTFIVVWGGVNAILEIAMGAIFAAALVIPLNKVKRTISNSR